MVTIGKPDGRVQVGLVWLENVMLGGGADGRYNQLGKHPQEKLEESHVKLRSNRKQHCPLISESN